MEVEELAKSSAGLNGKSGDFPYKMNASLRCYSKACVELFVQLSGYQTHSSVQDGPV